MVTPRYLPPLLWRSSIVLASNVGSNWCATSVIACTNPSTLRPMSLIGNSDGYSIRDSARGWSGVGIGVALTRQMDSSLGTGSTGSRSQAGLFNGLLISRVQFLVDRAGLARTHGFPVQRGHRQHLF